VFALANMDYRAEGTLNKLGLRALGRKGMRVYDFGWSPEPTASASPKAIQ